MTSAFGGGRHLVRVAAAAAVCSLLAACGAGDPATPAATSPSPSWATGPEASPAATVTHPAGDSHPAADGAGDGARDGAARVVDPGLTLPRAVPVGLSIPAIGVETGPLVGLGRLPSGEVEVPADYDRAGWYEPGPAPGQFGPAAILGHVDSTSGPAVFYRLRDLRPGDEIEVRRDDGTTAVFVVDRVARFPKDDFPTREVYGNTTGRAELRLITCGGDFDRAARSYRDNVVAFAHLDRTG